MNRTNLLRLAQYLDTLPTDYSHFDMKFYVQNGGIQGGFDPINISHLSDCGTVACAVGHAPSIPGLEAAPRERWDGYVSRVFGIRTEEYDEEFLFMFGSGWADVDNTPAGAAKRIRYFLNHGVPDDFDCDDSDLTPFVELYANA